MIKLPIVGGCLCGEVRYEITQEWKTKGLCYCRACQRATGSSYFPFLAISSDGLNISGKLKWYESPGENNSIISRGFCGQCGSRLFGKSNVMANLLMVSASSLDMPEKFQPEIAVWVEEAQPWCPINPQVKQFNKNSVA